MNVGEGIALFASVFIISRFRRVLTGLILLLIMALVSFITMLIKLPQDCSGCEEGLLQVALVSLFRLLYYLQVGFFYIHGLELFPVSIRTIGFGTCSAFGTIGIFLSQYMFVAAFESNINYFLIIGCACLLHAFVLWWLPETYGQPNRDQVL